MSDHISTGPVSGGGFNIGGHGNVINQGQPAPAPASAREETGPVAGAAAYGLHAFADIVGYSNFSARLQRDSQEHLVSLLDASLAEAGVDPGQVTAQDQGDARLLWFTPGTDAAKVLAVMPRYLNDDLLARNQDMAPHARMRVRLSFTMGASAPGRTGLAGAAPIAAARLSSAAVFRHAMNAAPQAQCGVIIDSHLHSEYVRQGFRADINSGDYVSVHVSHPDKGFEATAWLKLFGYSSWQVTALLD
jgi:hypothetical protein